MTELNTGEPTVPRPNGHDDPGPTTGAVEDDGKAAKPEFGGGAGPARKIAITVGAVLIGLVALLAFAGGEEEADGVSALLRQRTPAVTGTAIDGRSYDIDDHRGEWVLVNFFATWCAPCIAEHPDLVELEQWGEREGNLSLVSVVFNDPVERVEEFFAEAGGTWPVLNSPAVPVDFGVAQVPETFLISPAGQVVLHIQGGVRAAELIGFIEESS